ncbi:hypothetical protein M3676_14750 [Metabacillus litoralis]|nr:hypothetical protein [Metabacillus litoralis]
MYRLIKGTYRSFIKRGWTLNEIDESDIFFLYELLGEDEKQEIKYADQVPWL